jgi:hypothetical protein
VFAFALLLLRFLDRFAARPARAAPVFVPEPETPRLRRRDLHPDAPVCRPISATRDLGEPAPPTAVAPRATWLPDPEPDAAPAAEVQAAPEPEAAPAPQSVPHKAAPARTEAVPKPARKQAARQESISELMARLERGLARRPRASRAAVAEESVATPQVFPPAADDRLQSAIDSLQRLAARHD